MNFRVAVSLMLLAACAKSAEQKQAEAALRGLAEAGKKMGEAAGAALGTAAAGPVAKEPVDFRDLKALMPEDLSGMRRTSSDGEKAGAMGFIVSNAQARYEAEDGGRITVKITDMGAVAGVAAMAGYAWAMAEIDRETESGYERTVTIGGHRGYEKYNREGKSGEVSLLVANRFVVEIDGDGITMEALKAAVDKVDLGKLESMKSVGVQ